MDANNVVEQVESFLVQLQAALGTQSLYSGEHKIAQEAVARAYASLQSAVSMRQGVTIGLVGGELAFDTHPLHRVTKTAAGLIKALETAHLDKITFRREVTKEDLSVFLTYLAARQQAGGKDTGAPPPPLGLTNIVIGNIGIDDEAETPPPEQKDAAEVKACSEELQKGVGVLEDVANAFGDGLPLDPAAANAFVGRIIERLMTSKFPLLIAASLKRHDPYSFVHSLNVCLLTLAQAQFIGMDNRYLPDAGLAGLLHDAGKLALSGQIIRKKEKLTDEEFDQVKSHPSDGAKLLLRTPDISPLVAGAAFEHHVRHDRAGYPKKPFGGEQGLLSALVEIADIYDALRSIRSYRGEMAPEQAYEEMKKMSGTHLHPDLVEAFFKSVGVYPPGATVELDDGHVGIVTKANASDIHRPEVDVCWKLGGAKVQRRFRADLTEKSGPGQYRRSIRRTLLSIEGYELPPEYRQAGMAGTVA
jgi:HD-GYP domain-containing protein (c-di-GMP phosphodiesterase class II)